MPLGNFGDTMVALVAIMVVFGWLTVVPVAAVAGIAWTVVAAINRRLKMRRIVHEEVKLALEKGADPQVIRELLRGFEGTPRSLLLKGVFTLGWGVALAGFFGFLEMWSLAFLFGIGFGVMGLGFIVYDIIRRRAEK